MTKNIVVLKNVHKIYDPNGVRVHALRGIDLEVREGEMLAIMGPSGCGKSTLLNLLGGIDIPTEGSIIINGVDITALSDAEKTKFRRDNIGYIFQLFNLLDFLTAVENVALPLLLQGYTMSAAAEEAKMLLRQLGLGDRIYHYPNQLSGGQAQRVAVARALMTHPAIILGDEPTGDLDTNTSLDIMALFRRINKQNKQTLIVVTHSRMIAEKCDRIVHIEDGKIIREEVVQSAKEEVV